MVDKIRGPAPGVRTGGIDDPCGSVFLLHDAAKGNHIEEDSPAVARPLWPAYGLVLVRQAVIARSVDPHDEEFRYPAVTSIKFDLCDAF